MNKNAFRSIFLLVITVGLSSTVTAQKKPTKESAKTSVAFDVRLPVSVIDKKRQSVSGLTSEDFIVLENGRRQKTVFFTDEKNNPPVFVGVLMDTSPSMQKKINFIKDGVKSLIYSITRSRKDKAAFLTFDGKITFIQDFTDKIDLLDAAINKVKNTGQQNSFYDAIWQFCDEKLRNAPGRRALVIISDGKDTSSRVTLKDAIDIAQQTETVVFIVSSSDIYAQSSQNSKNRKIRNAHSEALLKLTAETGGATFFADDTLSLDKSFSAISKEIRSQYVLTYRPKNQKYDGKKRKVEVRLTDKAKSKIYKIRAKTKYRLLKNRRSFRKDKSANHSTKILLNANMKRAYN